MLQFLGRGTDLVRNIVYFVAYIAYGMYNIALGPLIPYLSEESGKVQTEYSFLFICRAAGMLAGAAIFHKYQSWPSRPSYHKVLALSFAVIILTNFLFLETKSSFFQGFWNFLAAIPYFLVEVIIDLCVISLGKSVDELMLLISACFGIGALSSPIIIGFLGANAYYVFATMFGCLIPLILLIPSPEVKQEQKKEQATQEKATLNATTVNILCGAYFIYLGLLIAKLAWSSSFAVMACEMTKQQATVFFSLNAAFCTGTKFVWLFIPLKGSERLVFAIRMLVMVSILSLLITTLGWARQALFFDSIIMGVFMSPVSSQILAIGSEFGRPVTEGQASKIATWGVIGQGILSMICGSLMSFNINIYYYFSIAACLALWIASHKVLIELKGGKKTEKQESLLEMQTIE